MKEVLDFVNFDFHLPVTDPTWIFFLVLVIILFAPIVLERLRIPHIIGMIPAGVVIGEHGFNNWHATAASSCLVRWGFITSCSLPDLK